MKRTIFLLVILTLLFAINGCGREGTTSTEISVVENAEPWESDGKTREISFERVSKKTPHRDVILDNLEELSALIVFNLEPQLRNFEQDHTWLGNFNQSQLNEDGLGPFSLDVLEKGKDGRYIISHVTGENDGNSLNLKYWSIRDFDTGIYYFNYPMEDEDLYDYDSLRLISPKNDNRMVGEILGQALSPKYGSLMEQQEENDDQTLIVKVKMDSNTVHDEALSLSLENLYDFIKNQYCFRYSKILYFAYAQEDWGTDQTILSFRVGEKGIQTIDKMGEYKKREVRDVIRDLWTFETYFGEE